LCLYEFYRLLNIQRDTEINPYIHGVGGAIMFITVFLYINGTAGRMIFSLYLLYIVGTLICELYANRKNPIERLAYIFFGQGYIAVPFSVLNVLAFPESGANGRVYQWIWIIALFVFIWANDTGAYLIGVSIGKHRLFERISPKKSWEGFFGGMTLSVSCSLILSYLCPQIPLLHWVGLGVFIVVLATFGDLTESLIKRTLGVKDSGKALPGHGGFLDRFDSMLFAIYVLAFYIEIVVR